MWKVVSAVMVLSSAVAFAADPAAPPGAWKQDPKVVAAAKAHGKELWMSRTCFSCHGKDAKTPLLPEYPRLAGQGAYYAERQIRDIKSGARSNGNTAAMKGIMVVVPDEDIAVLAQYVSTLK